MENPRFSEFKQIINNLRKNEKEEYVVSKRELDLVLCGWFKVSSDAAAASGFLRKLRGIV